MEHLPAPVGTVLTTLGANLKTARLRRGLTVQELAEQVGVSRQLVAEAERGKPMTGVAVYAALLWALGLLDGLADVANPGKDKVGLAGALVQGRSRGRRADDS
ncbi:MAG TPA: helix-turn-helix transcriptional regulator [Myxococcales bacterium]|jgi:transcriptional regulator with XRE-family HTH domain